MSAELALAVYFRNGCGCRRPSNARCSVGCQSVAGPYGPVVEAVFFSALNSSKSLICHLPAMAVASRRFMEVANGVLRQSVSTLARRTSQWFTQPVRHGYWPTNSVARVGVHCGDHAL